MWQPRSIYYDCWDCIIIQERFRVCWNWNVKLASESRLVRQYEREVGYSDSSTKGVGIGMWSWLLFDGRGHQSGVVDDHSPASFSDFPRQVLHEITCSDQYCQSTPCNIYCTHTSSLLRVHSDQWSLIHHLSIVVHLNNAKKQTNLLNFTVVLKDNT